jgi:hypothetical protein
MPTAGPDRPTARGVGVSLSQATFDKSSTALLLRLASGRFWAWTRPSMTFSRAVAVREEVWAGTPCPTGAQGLELALSASVP